MMAICMISEVFPAWPHLFFDFKWWPFCRESQSGPAAASDPPENMALERYFITFACQMAQSCNLVLIWLKIPEESIEHSIKFTMAKS